MCVFVLVCVHLCVCVCECMNVCMNVCVRVCVMQVCYLVEEKQGQEETRNEETAIPLCLWKSVCVCVCVCVCALTISTP